jgi:peptide/nickel transport system substrate-binding protein
MSFTFPSFSQWKQIFKVLKKGEKITLLVFFVLAAGSLIFLVTTLYINNTKPVPALGGTYVEGVVGQPRFINPLYGETNDVDRSLIDLTFSGLMTYDNQGQIVNDLTDSYTVSSDGKTYDFTLKKNIFWHDDKPLTTDDVVFTIKTIQNSDYKSPLRANWIDVDVKKISDTVVEFNLKSPYNSFLENCTVKIIPQHIWASIPPENALLSSYNLQPIGSGPFIFSGLDQTNSGFINNIYLSSNRKYYGHASFIANITFAFFEKKEDLVKAANSGQVNGFTLAALDNNELEAEKSINQTWSSSEKFSEYSFSLPRYFAVFFNNQKASIFSDVNLRQAMSYAVNTDDIVKKIGSETKTQITAVNSPILPDFFGFQPTVNIYHFDTTQAGALLNKSGFKADTSGLRAKAINKKPAFQFTDYLKYGSKGTQVTQLQACLAKLNTNIAILLGKETVGTYGSATEDAVTAFQQTYLPNVKSTGETGQGTRQKLNQLCTTPAQNSQPLKFTIVTVNQPQLVEVANMLKDYWQHIGATVDINAVSLTDLKPIIKNRNYDVLLYGEALGAEPDLYPFWHSSQKLDPGLNLSGFENKDADQLLRDARETLDPSTKEQKLEKLQDIITGQAPALFLYNPDYIYWVSNTVKGIDTTKIIDPAKRFSNISNWYLTTKRVWK